MPFGDGGKGGVWGAAGAAGGAGLTTYEHGVGAAGGQPGKAVALNGKTVTWLGGNDGTHVVGAVSN